MRPTFFVQYMPDHPGKEFRVKVDGPAHTVVVRIAVDYDLLKSGKYEELQLINDLGAEACRIAADPPADPAEGVTIAPEAGLALGLFELKPPRWLR